jgi:hypothetical protein
MIYVVPENPVVLVDLVIPVVPVRPVHFLRIFQWWAKTGKRPIFFSLLPG